jgi:hypothetical protein
MFEKTGQKSTAFICGGSVEAGLRSLVDGRFAKSALNDRLAKGH